MASKRKGSETYIKEGISSEINKSNNERGTERGRAKKKHNLGRRKKERMIDELTNEATTNIEESSNNKYRKIKKD